MVLLEREGEMDAVQKEVVAVGLQDVLGERNGEHGH